MLRGNKPNADKVRHIPRQLDPGNINVQQQAHIIAKLSNAANAGPNGIGTRTVLIHYKRDFSDDVADISEDLACIISATILIQI